MTTFRGEVVRVVVFFILIMTTFEVSKSELEIKAWIEADVIRTLDEMGYSSYQEYLDDMSYYEMMNPSRD